MPNRHTYFSMFTGAGGGCIGAQNAGLLVKGGIEIFPGYQAIAAHNGLTHTRIDDVRNISFEHTARPTWLHASPSCQRASCAHQTAGETPLDVELGKSIARAIKVLKPGYVSIENVIGYRKFWGALCPIYEALKEYSITTGVVMASNHGVPQARKRWFLLASKHRVPVFPAIEEKIISWDAAVKPFSKPPRYKLSDRMIKKLHAVSIKGPSLVAGWQTNKPLHVVERGQPAMTLIKKMVQPSMRPHIVFKDKALYTYPLTLEMMSHLQGFPPTFDWRSPMNKSDVYAFEALGNSVPPLLMEKIVRANLPI